MLSKTIDIGWTPVDAETPELGSVGSR